VNGNRRSAAIGDFIDLATIASLTGNTPRSLEVHRGFLNAARQLAPRIEAQLKVILDSNQGMVEIIFAGHSAGGAVSSLLFAHFMSYFTKYDMLRSDHITISSITFGAPPLFSSNPTSRFRAIQRTGILGQGLMLAFITEGDPVPRTDDSYLKVLLGLLTTQFGQGNQDSGPTLSAARNLRPALPLPPLSRFSLGELIIIRDLNADAEDDSAEELQASVLTAEELGELLFGNFFAHHMNAYVEVCGSIGRGQFNELPESSQHTYRF
jgi:hypothetical protein